MVRNPLLKKSKADPGSARFRFSTIAAFIAVSLAIQGCSEEDRWAINFPRPEAMREVPIALTKWYGDHPCAASISFDINFESEHARNLTRSLRALGIRADFELTSATYEQRPEAMEYLIDTLIPLGFGYYGHGREHINHDAVSFDSAYASFKSNADFFRRYGLLPIAYAYPGGYGYRGETRTALKAAGFRCGRMFTYEDNLAEKALIMPDQVEGPPDWFELPSIAMHLSGFEKYPFIKTHGQLEPLLEAASNRNAWICITYHTISDGISDSSYPHGDWERDMSEIKRMDFWTAPMNTVVSYVLEKNSTNLNARLRSAGGRDQLWINVENDFEDGIQSAELTVEFAIPDTWVNRPLEIHRNGEYLRTSTYDTRSALLDILPESGEYTLTPLQP